MAFRIYQDWDIPRLMVYCSETTEKKQIRSFLCVMNMW